MADGDVVIELIDSKLATHNAVMPHSSHDVCDTRIADLEARIAELEAHGHRHEASDDYDIEEVE